MPSGYVFLPRVRLDRDRGRLRGTVAGGVGGRDAQGDLDAAAELPDPAAVGLDEDRLRSRRHGEVLGEQAVTTRMRSAMGLKSIQYTGVLSAAGLLTVGPTAVAAAVAGLTVYRWI
jgi:hypothetical protein